MTPASLSPPRPAIRSAAAALLLTAALRAAPGSPAPLADAAFLADVRRETEWLAGVPTRAVGTPTHDVVLDQLAARLRAIPGLRVWTDSFSTVVPTTDSAYLEISDGPHEGRRRVYPLWPALARLNSTPSDGIEGELVYVGEGRLSEIPAHRLRGQIAVLEMTGGGHWRDVHNAGATAVLLLGSEAVSQYEAHAHLLAVPVNVPRFYLPPGELANALRAGAVPRGRLFARGQWIPAQARNFYALLAPNPPAERLPALVLLASTDSTSIVPDLAPGADAAVDAAFLLALARRLAANPPPRPVLFAFLDAQAINQLGVRTFLASTAILPADRAEFLKEDRELLAEYETAETLAHSLAATPDALDTLHERRYRPLHRYVKDEVAREVVSLEDDLGRLRLRARESEGAQHDALQAQVARMAETRGRLNSAQVMILGDRNLTPDIVPLALDLWNRARRRIERQRQELVAILANHAAQARLRRELLDALGLPTDDNASPLGFLFGLDLSDAGVAAGPSLLCHHWYANETANAAEFRAWLTKVADRETDALWPAALRPAVNLTPFSALDSIASHTVGRQPNLTGPAASFQVGAMTWATLDGFRARTDTPNDRADRLDWERLSPQIEATRRLLERCVDRTDFRPRRPTGRSDNWRGIRGAIVERSVGEPVPRLPMEGYLTTLVSGMSAPGRAVPFAQPPVAGVRFEEFVLTGADGRFRFEALPAMIGNGPNPNVAWALKKRLVQAYRLREDGAIVRAVDMNKAGKSVRLDADLSRHVEPLRAVVFTGEELSLVGLTDPRFLTAPSPWSSSLLDAARGGKPQRVNLAMHSDAMAAVLEPGTRWMLALRQGATQNRMALLNVRSDGASHGSSSIREAMHGFETTQRLDSCPELVAARDLAALDDRRLADYARAGIRSEAIEALRERSRALLDRAEEALRGGDAAALYTAAIGALAHEGRAYQAIRDLANDVVRAAIFLLLALAPFAFAFERLVFASSHVYRQLLAALLTFAAMTAILWSFHPAFRISNQPLIVIMAFGILLMSLMVMSVVYARFKAGLDETRRGKADTSGARASGGGVLMSAAILGLANMRKRKLRTALTGATIVLVTFALLCFSSINSYTEGKEFKINARSPYTGVLLRLPASRPLPAATLPYLTALHGEKAAVPSYWWVDAYDRQWRIHARNPRTGAQVSLKAALGLSPGEAALTGVDRVLPDWDRFAAGEGCYLAAPTAAELGLKPGDDLLVAGGTFRLLGAFDATVLASEIKCLDGLSLLPYDYSALDDDQRRDLASTEFSVLSSHLENAASMEPGVNLPTVQGNELVILPAKEMQSLGRGATLRTIGLRTDTLQQARGRALDLAGRMAVPAYFGTPDEVNVVAATPLKPVAPRGLALPIAIAGLIVFNTMLSSIAERKREIHVYTSLGLAPVHVGVLFLAEAVTYGLMGSIVGYVVGQGAATVLSRLGWLGGITLNYSGTQAVTTMAIVQGIVIVSAIVPAIVAGRIASPSHEMNWSVPPPDHDTIRDLLPFTVTHAAADGAMCFLREYLDAHREGSIGHFSTDALRLQRPDGGGPLALHATVWLAPYDLGVRQELEIRVCPTDAPDVCEIRIELRRGTGQTRTWWKLNRLFLGALRRQLLGWRKLGRDRVLAYIAEGREL